MPEEGWGDAQWIEDVDLPCELQHPYRSQDWPYMPATSAVGECVWKTKGLSALAGQLSVS